MTDEPATTSEQRVWIIQCKRERSIGPKKARQIINEFFSTSPPTTYGYILAAACISRRRLVKRFETNS